MATITSRHCCFMMVALATLYAVQAKVIDLSHDHSVTTFMSTPLHPKYKVNLLFEGMIQPGNVYAKSNSYSIAEHGGTHIDAPKHFSQNGNTLDQIPIENTMADGIMIDCTEEVDNDPDYALTLQKVLYWEKENGEIPRKGAVVVNFNWSRRFNNISEYFNTDEVDDGLKYRFPVVSAEAINHLVDNRDINILAVDTMGPDLMTSNFPTHVKMLTNNKIIAENIKDPGRLPKRGFRFFATPVKFVGATGVQVRAFAIVSEGDDTGGSGNVFGSSMLVTCSVMLVSVFSRFFA